MNVEDLGNNKYKVGDIVVFKKKAVWSGSDEITGKITGIDYDDDFGWFYYTDIKRNGKPIEILEKSIIKKINQKKNMKKTTKKSARSTTARRKTKASGTMSMAAKILHAQKADYQKIFRSEVKKSKDPKVGAKNAGKIYRDRYGATATARWKKALKRAK